MSVFIGNVEIEGDFIDVFEGYFFGSFLSGVALEEEGKRIYDRLKDY